MARYNHLVELCFSVYSDKEDGSDITEEMLWDALKERLRMAPGEIMEACLPVVAGATEQAD